MSDVQAFRFGAESFESTRAGVLADARKAESLGFDVFLTPDHLFDHLAPIATTMMVAEQAEGLRVGTYVLCNDFHHPVIMAKEAATLDVLSEGRFELGLGAGYLPVEYQMAGIAFDPGPVRLQRLTETVQIAKLAFASETFSFDGAHYQVRDYKPCPQPVQRPRPSGGWWRAASAALRRRRGRYRERAARLRRRRRPACDSPHAELAEGQGRASARGRRSPGSRSGDQHHGV